MNQQKLYSLCLLFLLLCLVFGIPFLPQSAFALAYLIFLTLVTFACVFVLEKRRTVAMILALVIMVVRWGLFFSHQNFGDIHFVLLIVFLLWILGRIFLQIVSTPRSTDLVIIDCINGYFLLATISATLIGLTHYFYPSSFTFTFPMDSPLEGMNEYIYFSLVAFTTTGFGDIVPHTPAGKAVSNFVSVAGQLYVAIVMALMIGRYIARVNKD